MLIEVPRASLTACVLVLTLANIAKAFIRRRFPFDSYIVLTWVFFLSFFIADVFSFIAAIWILALVSFAALREYFSLIDIRLQDRLGILGAYLSIPFMFYMIQLDWYGMFIISIPVYSFLMIPLLVSLGGRERRGTIFSIGALDFGLFLFVFCLGHIGYLMLFSPWKAAMLIIVVAICDVAGALARKPDRPAGTRVLFQFAISLPFAVGLTVLLSPWSAVPVTHSIALGFLIPVLVVMGHHTADYVKADLGISEETLLPGRGQILDNLKGLLFAGPVTFHYIRYFLT